MQHQLSILLGVHLIKVMNALVMSIGPGPFFDCYSSGARKIQCKFTSRALQGNLKNLLSGLHVARSNGPGSLYTGVNGSE